MQIITTFSFVFKEELEKGRMVSIALVTDWIFLQFNFWMYIEMEIWLEAPTEVFIQSGATFENIFYPCIARKRAQIFFWNQNKRMYDENFFVRIVCFSCTSGIQTGNGSGH